MTQRVSTDASALESDAAESRFAEVNGVRLHVVAAGEADAPLVVLLHGFPEFWYGWHRSIEAFVEAGYRVLVPDQRGYNLSEKPDGVASYRIGELVADVAGLVDATDRESAHVVGHDWGAIVAWELALRRPEVVDRLGIVNVPHPTVFEETLTSNPRQLLKSWYMFFFQLPRIPEWAQRRDEFALLVDSLQEANGGAFTDDDLDRYRAAWDRERGVTGMLNWYRALFRHNSDPPRDRVAAPTLVVWGEQDEYLLTEMAPRSVGYCDDGRLERIPDGTHWVHHEHPHRVTELLVDHLA